MRRRSASTAGLRRRLLLGWALTRALVVYWLVVFPRARREVRRWNERALAIGDPALRRLALGKLDSERLVAEGAAAFALFAAPAHRADVVRAAVAYEILYDVVDAIGEAPAADPLAHNRAAHAALLDAVAPGAPPRHRLSAPRAGEDGCYLQLLVRRCREALCRLPAHRLVLPALQRFAARAIEAQSLNHAGVHDDQRALATWAASQPVPERFWWWEVAAAAGDPLGVFALLGMAGDPRLRAFEVEEVEQAYFPWIGALVWLMESLVDQDDDALSGNPSYVGRYASPQHAAARLGVIAARAAAAASALRNGSSHAVLLAGVASLYLSDPHAAGADAAASAGAIRRALGWPVSVLLLVLRLRRRLS